jgi:hypothetical protein
MKTLSRYLSIALLGLSVIGAQANDHGDRQQYQQKRFDRMVERLELNQQQTEHINSVKESQLDQRQALGEERKALHAKMQALQADFRQQLEGVLSEEQLATYDKMQTRRQQKMEHKKGAMKKHYNG